MNNQLKREKYSSFTLDNISDVLSNRIVKYVPKLFTSIECIVREEDVLFLIRVPRVYVPEVKRQINNWPYFKSRHYNDMKFEVRTFPGIE